MKIKYLIMFILLTCSAFGAPIDDFVSASLENSPEVKAAQQSYVKAGFDKLSAVAMMLPSAGLSHNRFYSWGDEFRERSHETYAWLNQTVFAGFTYSGRVAAASINEDIMKIRLELAKQNVKMTAVKNYYAYVSAAMEHSNQTAAIDIMKKRLVELKRRESIGKVRSSDRASMEAVLAATEGSLPGLAAAMENAKSKLKQMCGCEASADAQIIPDETDLKATDIASAAAMQPGVLEAKKNLDAADTASLLSKGTFLPNASISLKKNISDAPAFTGDLTGSLNLTWSLFEGGERVFTMLALDAAALSAGQKYETESRTALYNIETTDRNTRASRETALLLKKAAELSEQARKMKESDYYLGMATNLEVISAMSDELDAKRKYARSLAQAASDTAVLKILIFEDEAAQGGAK